VLSRYEKAKDVLGSGLQEQIHAEVSLGVVLFPSLWE
jgi:hypothetical protein